MAKVTTMEYFKNSVIDMATKEPDLIPPIKTIVFIPKDMASDKILKLLEEEK